ncbi:P1 family peptidase [Nakamurella lactea]|uniref:P1 family peptidase n=1 Tax=Nakamurella lactea TaxID=459515 RepID=UPI000403E0A4|nr:P1 family peptidase [Nakamurella lactea]
MTTQQPDATARYRLTAAQTRALAPLLTGRHAPGPLDAIVDVAGIRVGHTTVTDGTSVRTGVTAVVPDQLDSRRLPANLAVGNGHGKLVGATQLVELGELETPILLTATLSTFRVADALVTWMLGRPGQQATTTLNPVVGECNDAGLSDIRLRPITPEHVFAALDGASAERPGEGAIGAGTGMSTMGFKGGIGTASRCATVGETGASVGVLALTNFSGRLPIAGLPNPPWAGTVLEPEGNSCVLLVATDAPVDARQLGRIARRAVYAMGPAGAEFAHGSGDYAIAFGTADPDRRLLPDRQLTPIFTATTEATVAAIVHSLLAATGATSASGRVVPGLLDVWRP